MSIQNQSTEYRQFYDVLLRENIDVLLTEVKTLVEGRVTTFRQKYGKAIPQYISSVFIDKDPSKVNKYLDWLGKVVGEKVREGTFGTDDASHLMDWLGLFQRKGRGVDIYSFKDLDSFIEYMTELSGQMSNRQKIEKQASILFINDDIKVVAPGTHEASKHFGGGSRWCISTGNDGYWKQYYCEHGDSIVFIIFRKTGDKVAIVGDSLDYASFYDKKYNMMDREERNEIIHLLQTSINSDDESAWDAVENHIYNDDGNDRRSAYEYEQQAEEFESSGKTTLDKSIRNIIDNEIPEGFEIDDELWKTVVMEVFATAESYTTFLRNVWWGSISRGYNGDIDDIDDLIKSLRERGDGDEDSVNQLIKSTRNRTAVYSKIDNIISNILEPVAYDMFINKNWTEYIHAMDDIRTSIEAKVNDPRQTVFGFHGDGKVEPSFRSFEEVIKMMVKLGYDNLAREILKYARGDYNKQA